MDGTGATTHAHSQSATTGTRATHSPAVVAQLSALGLCTNAPFDRATLRGAYHAAAKQVGFPEAIRQEGCEQFAARHDAYCIFIARVCVVA